MRGADIKDLASDFIESWLRFAAADLGTLNHGIEPFEDQFNIGLTAVLGLGIAPIATDHVVGQTSGLEARHFDEVEGSNHLGANLALEEG
ncbi:unannotated protein [freshwater metagenome]|uniref:Unannotated protein n=1 Tax=freshwater metagenome TaxID=449393 RepID=A0A6J7LKT9_9ZZZZ